MEDAESDSSGASRCLLLELNHDLLGVLFDGLADPLQPAAVAIAVALSSTCKGLWTLLRSALEVLVQQHKKVLELCRKLGTPAWSCELLRKEHPVLILTGIPNCFTADDMAALGLVLRRQSRLVKLDLHGVGDAGVQSLCESLGDATLPNLRRLRIHGEFHGANVMGPTSAEALAITLPRLVLAKLEELDLKCNPFRDHGICALAGPLRKLPRLKKLNLICTGMGNDGVAALFGGLGKEDFKALEHFNVGAQDLSDESQLPLNRNRISHAGVDAILAAIDGDALPRLEAVVLRVGLAVDGGEDASSIRLRAAITRAKARRARAN